MRPARVILLLVALIAGGLAAYLATRGSGQPPRVVIQQAAAPQPEGTRVLVAKAPIGVGQRLDASLVDWQPWPSNAVRAEYITSDKSPDAAKDVTGAVARFEIFTGEPILDAKLVHSDQGIMSAVLDPGMRGVSIPVSAASGSGGFIIPNDRVDVVMTDSSSGQTTSRVVLSDVKVLAIGTRLGETGKTGAPSDPDDPKSQVFTTTIATLELSPGQADTLINASNSGKIALVLRSVVDFSKGPTTADANDNSDQTVKVIRFGREQNVTAGSPDQSPPPAVVAPAAYVPPATPIDSTATPMADPTVPTVVAAPPPAVPVMEAPVANSLTPTADNSDADSTATP